MTEPNASPVNRRQFLESSAKNAAGVAAGMVALSQGAALAKSAGERLSIGVIGVRNQGRNLAERLAAFPDVRVAALCDVDMTLTGPLAESLQGIQGTKPSVCQDFRLLLDDPGIDAVVVATPDHWHALMTIMACQAGKDVYVEKPVSQTIVEGELMLAAARKHQRVVQCGIQERSGSHFQSAVETIRRGQIGNVRLAKAWAMLRRKPIGCKRPAPPPDGVNYSLWLGPASERAFTPNRFHGNWRWFWDYGAGELGHWGVHLLDVARWGLDVGLPTRISSSGGKYHFQDDQETPDTLSVQFSYPQKTILWEHRLWTSHGNEGRSAAVAFYGDEGTLIVDRGGWKVYDQKESLTDQASELGNAHLRNFIDCCRTRQTPSADLETGHLSSSLCHLGNIAHRLGQELHFNPRRMNFDNHPAASKLLTRDYRAPWELPAV